MQDKQRKTVIFEQTVSCVDQTGILRCCDCSFCPKTVYGRQGKQREREKENIKHRKIYFSSPYTYFFFLTPLSFSPPIHKHVFRLFFAPIRFYGFPASFRSAFQQFYGCRLRPSLSSPLPVYLLPVSQPGENRRESYAGPYSFTFLPSCLSNPPHLIYSECPFPRRTSPLFSHGGGDRAARLSYPVSSAPPSPLGIIPKSDLENTNLNFPSFFSRQTAREKNVKKIFSPLFPFLRKRR